MVKMHGSVIKNRLYKSTPLSEYSFLPHMRVIGYAVGFYCYSRKRQLFNEEAKKGKRNVWEALFLLGIISTIVF